MAITKEEKEFAAYVVDLSQAIGPVYSKRMFGGFGIFLDGMMFGLIAENILYLKVDDEIRADFEELGLQPFTYDKQGRQMRLSYYQAPEEALENMDIMLEWGNKGFAAALRASVKKNKRAKAKKAR
ncbi:MAG: TfoX/Sxy family protein [Gammaproteobacteria bacterium]|nr:TfoX/Sxy family protein [Gammaproteobacteria bacterium]|tara:strand:- start:869 stop:1246 length:378 start_codon:yes stop_codon:yes gene_type:complete